MNRRELWQYCAIPCFHKATNMTRQRSMSLRSAASLADAKHNKPKPKQPCSKPCTPPTNPSQLCANTHSPPPNTAATASAAPSPQAQSAPQAASSQPQQPKR